MAIGWSHSSDILLINTKNIAACSAEKSKEKCNFDMSQCFCAINGFLKDFRTEGFQRNYRSEE